MKIGIFFDGRPIEGGNYQHSYRTISTLKKMENSYGQVYLTSDQKNYNLLKENNNEVIYYKKSINYRIQLLLLKFSFFRLLFKKLKLKTIFDSIGETNDIDIFLFNSPSEDSLLVTKIPFIFTLFELQHRTDNYLPEYYGNHDFDLRDTIISNAARRSFKIIVATKKDRDLLIKFYNTYDENIVVQPYLPILPKVFEEEKETDFNLVFSKLNIKFKDFIFYPAQFWPHKNHRYIIDSVEQYIKKKNKKINVVFSGSDKGNYDYINKIIKTKGLENNFQTIGFVSNKEIISIYKKTKALIMPTFVGHSSLPMYEAFYFNVPVIYTKNLLDENLRPLVFEIDINNTNDLINVLDKIDDVNEKNTKISKANEYYINNCNEQKLLENFKKMFDKYNYVKTRWIENN